MYRIIKPKKFQLYVTSKSNKKYAYEVREETGADIVINCTLYNTSTWKPVCDVKANGTILSNDQYAYWGYGWNNNESTMHMVNNINLYQNYISCAALIRDNSDCLITAGDDVLRAAGRTAIGFREDGQMVVWCVGEGIDNMTLYELRSKMYDLGCVSALALDGGGSSQLSQAGNNYVYSSRKVQNYLCIWIDDGKVEETDDKEDKNPYVEPTKNVSIGATGESVKWVQYELNEKLDIEVDGVFGANTKEAVKLFQKMNGLGVDGIVGPATRKALGGN